MRYVVLADAICAVLIAGVVRVVGRRANQPVPIGSTIFIIIALTVPVILLYGIVALCVSLAGDGE
jgi:hypothetical protein